MSPKIRGFTLLEVMVTIAIVGILVGLSVMGFQSIINERRVTGAIREIWSLALQARQSAISHNQPVRFVVEDVERDGRTLKVVRWERLPCEDAWGSACPSSACTSATCRTGCPCDETGDEVVLPPELTASSNLHGLCFQAGTGRAYHGSGLGCEVPDPIPVTQVTFTDSQAPKPYVLGFEGLTGLAVLSDCNAANARADLCP